MNIVEILNSIWNFILDIPTHISNFFGSIATAIAFTKDIVTDIITVFESSITGINLSGSSTVSAMMITSFGLLTGIAVLFIFIDLLRDVL